MSPRPPGPQPGKESGPSGHRDEALFGHLFASRPPRQRRIGPWVVAALLHIPLVVFLVATDTGKQIIQHAELIIRPILTVDDNPPQIVAPIPVVPVPVAQAPEPEPEERTRVAPAAPLPEPGIPDPNALVTPPVAGPPVQPVPGGTGTGSVLDRMAAPRPDPRLFGPTDPSSLLTGPEAARARLAERLATYNDSVMAERLAAARATDWTTTDKDGKRWGVSPGKLHLGDITLPLPVAFATPPGRRDEVNERLREWSEIETQSARAEISDNFKDRVKEIRKRKDQERSARIAGKDDKKKTGSN